MTILFRVTRERIGIFLPLPGAAFEIQCHSRKIEVVYMGWDLETYLEAVNPVRKLLSWLKKTG